MTAVEYETWRMRDGTVIRIVDMADSHLLNTVRMLERGAKRRYEEACNQQSPFEEIVPEPEWFESSKLGALRNEAIRRGIKL